MTSSTSAIASTGLEGRYSSSTRSFLWIIPIVALAILIITFLVEADKLAIPGITKDTLKNITTILFLIAIIVLVLIPVRKLAIKSASETGDLVQHSTISGPIAQSQPQPAGSNVAPIEIGPEVTVQEASLVVDVDQPAPAGFVVKSPVEEGSSRDAGIAIAQEVLEFPEKVSGGIFGDTFIQIDGSRQLKLRSQLIDESYF